MPMHGKTISIGKSSTRKTPFDGIGKPEPLKGSLAGFWSRRINDEHRLVYAVEDNKVLIIACRGRYDS